MAATEISPTGTPIADMHSTTILEDIRTLHVSPNPHGNYVEQAKKAYQKTAETFVLFEEIKAVRAEFHKCVLNNPTDHYRKCRELSEKLQLVNGLYDNDGYSHVTKRFETNTK